MEGSQGDKGLKPLPTSNPQAGNRGMDAAAAPLMASFLYSPGSLSRGMLLPTVGSRPHLSTIKTISIDVDQRPTFQVILQSSKSIINTSHHSWHEEVQVIRMEEVVFSKGGHWWMCIYTSKTALRGHAPPQNSPGCGAHAQCTKDTV